jgi:hypothetical protein
MIMDTDGTTFMTIMNTALPLGVLEARPAAVWVAIPQDSARTRATEVIVSYRSCSGATKKRRILSTATNTSYKETTAYLSFCVIHPREFKM